MRWGTSLMVAMLIGVPLAAAAQEHRVEPGAREPHVEQADETPAATADAAMGPAMPCPMMGHGAMGAGAMQGMAPGGPAHRGMGPATRGGMMGMMPMPGPEADPKARGRWMQMRGEMMKAIGDILLRYGRELEATAPAR